MPVSTFNIVFEWEKKIAEGIVHLAFSKKDGTEFEFEPGQFITFLFGEGKDLKRRSYSVATIPSSDESLARVELIEIVVSYVPGGFASEILFHLKKGDVFTVLGPVGRLILRAEEPKFHTDHPRIFLLGTGTGIGPYRAMLPLLTRRFSSLQKGEVHLVLGVRTRTEAMFRQDFEAFSGAHPDFHFHAYFSRETQTHGSHESIGYVQQIFERFPVNPETDVVYLCGNPNMIDETFEKLKEEGLDISDIRREKYISS